MLVSVDTDAHGAAGVVAAVTRVNIRDALRSPALRHALILRCRDRRDLLRYADDATASPFLRDEWATWAVNALRYGCVRRDARTGLFLPGDDDALVKDDCEGLTAMDAAALTLTGYREEVWVAITHPRDSTVAHAYLRLGPRGPQQKVWDPSVHGGMRAPTKPGWYDQEDTRMVRIEPLLHFMEAAE